MRIILPADAEPSWLYHVNDGVVIWDEERMVPLIDEAGGFR